MRSVLRITVILCFLTSYVNAHQPKAYYFKATIMTLDTTITGYFYLPYESLPDSILTNFKSDNEYFKRKIKSNINQNGIELYSFLLKYSFNTAEKDTSNALCKSQDKILIKSDEIKNAEYQEVIVFSSAGNVVYSEISKK